MNLPGINQLHRFLARYIALFCQLLLYILHDLDMVLCCCLYFKCSTDFADKERQIVTENEKEKDRQKREREGEEDRERGLLLYVIAENNYYTRWSSESRSVDLDVS